MKKKGYIIPIIFFFSCGSDKQTYGKNIDTIAKTEISKTLLRDTLQEHDLRDSLQKEPFVSKFKFYIDKEGRKQGFKINMFQSDSIAGMVSYYQNDTQFWAAFPLCDHNFPYPIKGRGIGNKDSFYMVCPFNDTSNTIFYEGTFNLGKRVGIHKIYHTNGKLKFEVDWKTHRYKRFARTGKFMEEKNINEFRFTSTEN